MNTSPNVIATLLVLLVQAAPVAASEPATERSESTAPASRPSSSPSEPGAASAAVPSTRPATDASAGAAKPGKKKTTKSRFIPSGLADAEMPLASDTKPAPTPGSRSILRKWWFVGAIALGVGALMVTGLVLSSRPVTTDTEGEHLGVIDLRPVGQ